MTPSDKETIQIQYTSTRAGIVEADARRVFRAKSGRSSHILHLLFQLLFQSMYDNEINPRGHIQSRLLLSNLDFTDFSASRRILEKGYVEISDS